MGFRSGLLAISDQPVIPLTFTVDLEDPTEQYDPKGRFVAMTRVILDLCDEIGCKATFFIVGRIALAAPTLVKDIAARGHEIAYHSHAHIPLTLENASTFRTHCQADRLGLEQMTGQPVIGFRAPCYSLTRDSLWALDVLKTCGFRYSSSVMPTILSRFGNANLPQEPFLWPNGLIEIPLPVKGMGPFKIPYLGGIYLYAMPQIISDFLRHTETPRKMLWTYAHPYDFDIDAPYEPMPNTPEWISFVLWFFRRGAPDKIRHVLERGHAPTLGKRIDSAGFKPIQLPR